MNELVRLIGAVVAVAGYVLFYNTRRKDVFFVIFGGMLVWCVYVISDTLLDNYFFVYFFPAMFAAAISELFARIRKTLSIVFLFPGIITLVPGGSLYYAIRCLISGDRKLAGEKGEEAFLFALGIAFGIVVVSVITKKVSELVYGLKEKHK